MAGGEHGQALTEVSSRRCEWSAMRYQLLLIMVAGLGGDIGQESRSVDLPEASSVSGTSQRYEQRRIADGHGIKG
jgi:hypothetical protein